MLDRAIIEELLDWEFEGLDLGIAEDIPREAVMEAFCQYAEEDYYEWLKDNFRSFLDYGNPDWNQIIEKIRTNEE